MKLISVLVISVFIFSSCIRQVEEKVSPVEKQEISQEHKVQVKEFIQTSAYTYILVEENNKEFWLAVSKIEPVVGETYYYKEALEMVDFQSKELDRVFKSVFFVQHISKEPGSKQQVALDQYKHKRSTKSAANIDIKPVEGGVSIAHLFEHGEQYADKTVLVRGEIVKINKAIMEKNWVHLQDGSSFEGKNDLTLTTTQDNFKIGETVTFKGKVAVKKDFGSGYSYELIVEEAVKQ